MRWRSRALPLVFLTGCTVIGDDVVSQALCPWQAENHVILRAGLLPNSEDGVKALIAFEESSRRLDVFLRTIEADCP